MIGDCKMLKICRQYLQSNDTHTRLCADIDRDGEIKILWFEVEKKFAKYLLYERSDAFVIGLLQHAIQKGHDIVSEAPMTRRIYEQLTEQFMTCYNKMHGDFKTQKGAAVSITVPLADEISLVETGAVGTGISCGVDSLHVFATHPEVSHAVMHVFGIFMV